MHTTCLHWRNQPAGKGFDVQHEDDECHIDSSCFNLCMRMIITPGKSAGSVRQTVKRRRHDHMLLLQGHKLAFATL